MTAIVTNGVPLAVPSPREPEMSDTRNFDLGDVLTVTTGKLLSERGMGGVYDILNFMTGDNLFTHQLPRALRACREPLLDQHPRLRGVEPKGAEHESIRAWLNERKADFGKQLAVAQLAPQSWTNIDPVTEAELLFGKDRVISASVVVGPTGGDR